MRTITCECGDHSITIGEKGFTPFLLAGIDGIYEASNDLIISKNAMTDGGSYQGSTANVRDITLRLLAEPMHVWRQDLRDLLYSVFMRDRPGIMTVTENGVSRYITYRVERIAQSEWKKRLFFVYLRCEDPFFYDTSEQRDYLGQIVGRFEFQHQFTAQKEPISEIISTANVSINNDTGSNDIGMTIIAKIRGTVVNPHFSNVTTQEELEIEYTFEYGDLLEITTGQNDKHIYATIDGVKREINQLITEDSVFIQLRNGTNVIGFGAESGGGNMLVELAYRWKHEGA